MNSTLREDLGSRADSLYWSGGQRHAALGQSLMCSLLSSGAPPTSGATEQSFRDAVAAVGIGERTEARRWANDSFRRRVSELRDDMVSCSFGKIADGMADAADVLPKLLAAESQAVRLRAAVELAQLGLRLGDAVELEQRLLTVEKRTEQEGEQQ